MSVRFDAPVPLLAIHQCDDFRSTERALSDWLRRSALRNQLSGATRTFVVTVPSSSAVVGFYSLAAGSVRRDLAPGSIRRNMPEPIPVVVLARLAVDERFAGMGIGSGLLANAALRAIRIAGEIGVRALLCHAKSERAKEFYLHHGFVESPVEPLVLMHRIDPFQDSRAVGGRA